MNHDPDKWIEAGFTDHQRQINDLKSDIKDLKGSVEWLKRVILVAIGAWGVVVGCGTYILNWLFGGRGGK